MYPGIASQLRVEGSTKDVALSDSNNVTLPANVRLDVARRVQPARARRQSGQDFHLVSHCLGRLRVLGRSGGRHNSVVLPRLFDLHPWIVGKNSLNHGRADEDGVEWSTPVFLAQSLEKREVKVRLEALDLPAEMISVDAHVQAANELLAALLGAICGFRKKD